MRVEGSGSSSGRGRGVGRLEICHRHGIPADRALRVAEGNAFYFCAGGVSSDSWWNTAVHLPFFFVQTVDAHAGLGMGCPL